MPGINHARASPPGRRLPPLSREAEELAETTKWHERESQRVSTPPSRSKKEFTVSQADKVGWTPVTNMQVAVTPSKQVALPGDIIRKPRFLDSLETFLERELQSLGVETVQPNETRLQAHREVFEYLIEDFKTYKPIFAAIKNEYELMVNYQRDYLKQLEPLQQMLVTVTEQCDKQIMALRDKEKQDVMNLKRENEKLQSIIDQIRNDQFALQIQIERLQQRQSEQYDKYRSEADARKLLVSDINDLRVQQEDLIFQQQQANNRDASEDPVQIRAALKKAREDEKEASQLINDIIANYGDVIPKQDYLNLQRLFEDLQTRVTEKSAEFDSLKLEHDTLLETHRQVIKQRDEYYQESERLRQTATPRPNWNRCGDVIAGVSSEDPGVSRWNELAEGKSSDQLVDILLNELAGSGADKDVPDFFEPLGTGDGVRFDLRKSEGNVKNRRLGKRDATLLIKDVWREKDVYDTSQSIPGVRTLMAEYLMTYLNVKFPGNSEMVTEWTYNLDNACQRYVHDDKIQLFYQVIKGEVDQELYFVQLQYIVSLLKLLTKENETHEPPGVFTQAEFTQILNNFFGGSLEQADIDSLLSAAQVELDDSETTDIEFTRLFFEDDEGKFGPFVDELKKNFTKKKNTYVNSFIDVLKSVELETVTPDDFIKSLGADAELDAAKRDTLLFWVYKVKSKAELESVSPLTLEQVETELNNIHIKRFFV